jgi:hypothetical protein
MNHPNYRHPALSTVEEGDIKKLRLGCLLRSSVLRHPLRPVPATGHYKER